MLRVNLFLGLLPLAACQLAADGAGHCCAGSILLPISRNMAVMKCDTPHRQITGQNRRKPFAPDTGADGAKRGCMAKHGFVYTTR